MLSYDNVPCLPDYAHGTVMRIMKTHRSVQRDIEYRLLLTSSSNVVCRSTSIAAESDSSNYFKSGEGRG